MIIEFYSLLINGIATRTKIAKLRNLHKKTKNISAFFNYISGGGGGNCPPGKEFAPPPPPPQ